MTKPASKNETTKHIDYVMRQSKTYIRGYIEGMDENLSDMIALCNKQNRQIEKVKRSRK